MDSIRGYLTGKVVLVTGGGGSIGSEICRQVMRFTPNCCIIFDIYENCAYELECELKQNYGPDCPIRVRIGTICDKGGAGQRCLRNFIPPSSSTPPRTSMCR